MQLKIDFEKKQLTVIDVLNLKDLLEFVKRFVVEDNYADWVFMPEIQKEYLTPIPPLPINPSHTFPSPITCDGTGRSPLIQPTTTTSTESDQFTFIENKIPFRGPVNQYPSDKKEDYIASMEEVRESS